MGHGWPVLKSTLDSGDFSCQAFLFDVAAISILTEMRARLHMPFYPLYSHLPFLYFKLPKVGL